MSASLNVECGNPEEPKPEYNHTIILVTAIASLVVVPSLLLYLGYFVVLKPVVPFIESRTKRSGVSPLVDFLVAKWKPSKWHFAFIDMVRTSNYSNQSSPA